MDVMPNPVLQTALLYIRTASYLKKEQLFYRVWYGLRERGRRRVLRRQDRTNDQCCRPLKTAVPFLANSAFHTADVVDGRFRFLNDTVDFGNDPDWAAKDKDRLWRYNLHYFSYLMTDGGIAEQAARHLIGHWIAGNPPGALDAWDSFPISVRLVNWIKYISSMPSIPAWVETAARSVCTQALWLERSLEYHLMGNHLFKNAKALIFAGIFLRGRDAERLLTKGLKILKKELNEQVLPDGGHFERSPMYHSMILEDCLDLLNVLTGIKSSDRDEASCSFDETSVRLEETTSRMAAFLRGMVHPDKQIALFNDAALGIEQDPERLLSYYEAVTGRKRENPDRREWSFPQSGFFVMAPRPGDRLIADCGIIGPAYQPGHAHCDILSFELSLKGRRVIVDSGCSQYEEGEIRRYNRGNAGHNTISVDGRDQSEVWGAHRCARRASPIYARLDRREDGAIVFEGAHDGYKRFQGSPIHHRSIRWAANEIEIRDYVDGEGTHSIESRLHIHPDLTVALNDGAALISDKGEKLVEVFLSRGGEIETTFGWYSPEFGMRRKCIVLRVRQPRAELPYSACWTFRIMSSD
jgi:uncharacterized heparinase superfamily protein